MNKIMTISLHYQPPLYLAFHRMFCHVSILPAAFLFLPPHCLKKKTIFTFFLDKKSNKKIKPEYFCPENLRQYLSH